MLPSEDPNECGCGNAECGRCWPKTEHPLIDYWSLSGPDLLNACGDDAAIWAAAFRQYAIKLGYSDMDEGWLIGWFANAIEHSSAVREWRSKPATSPVIENFPK